ncbi:hypothetical protein [Bacillus altitudinis]|uniref:hypothetical protein n=1 Tax=Bacillus altitudinis TaxID=293387 RepID=UPI00366A930B
MIRMTPGIGEEGGIIDHEKNSSISRDRFTRFFHLICFQPGDFSARPDPNAGRTIHSSRSESSTKQHLSAGT